MNIERIIEELYREDPSLRRYDAEIRLLASSLQQSVATNEFSEEFRMRLRNELLLRTQSVARMTDAPSIDLLTFIKNNFMKRFSFAIMGALLLVIVAVPTMYFLNSNAGTRGYSSNNDAKLALTDSQVTPVAAAAFGSLASVSAESVARGAAAADSTSMVGAGGKVAGMGGGGGAAPSTMMVPPDYVSYRYRYAGDPLTVDTDTVEVLRRVKGFGTALPLSSILKSFKVGGLNLLSFGDSVAQSITFSQNKKFGYEVALNLAEGNVSINERWDQWYEPCTEQGCPQQSVLTLSDVPADDAVLLIANAFIREHGIDVSSYGEPRVSNEWRGWYNRDVAAGGGYIPEVISVVYPLQVRGSSVYDENGGLAGIRVNVNIRFKKVSSVWEIASQRYEASSYGAERNTETILAVAERGGMYGYVPEGGTVKDVSLGTPVTGLMRIWKHDGVSSSELLVPAFLFPITDTEVASLIGRTHIAVPLAKELLQTSVPPISPFDSVK